MIKKLITIGTIAGICSGALVACSPEEHQSLMADRASEYKTCVELGEYKGLDVTKVEKENSNINEDVESVLKNLYESLKEYEEVKESSQTGDKVTLDAVGYVADEAFENLEDFEYEIGSGMFVEGFDEQLTGKNINEEFDVTVTFPEDYGDEKVNGKEAVFKTTIKTIKRAKETELNDEWVAKNASALKEKGYECNNIEELKQAIKKNMEEQSNAFSDEQIASEVVEKVIDSSKFNSYPEEETKFYSDNIVKNIKQEFESYGTEYSDFNTFLSDAYELENEEALNTYATEQAQEYLKNKMVVTLIASENGIIVSDEDVEKLGNEMAAYYGFDSYEKMRKEYGDEVKEDFAYQALWSKVATYLVSVNNVTIEPEDIMTQETIEENGE